MVVRTMQRDYVFLAWCYACKWLCAPIHISSALRPENLGHAISRCIESQVDPGPCMIAQIVAESVKPSFYRLFYDNSKTRSCALVNENVNTHGHILRYDRESSAGGSELV